MKKILVALSLLALTGTSMAQHYHGHGFRHHNYHGPRVIYRDNWIAPAVGAFIIGAAINEAHNRQVQSHVIIQNSPTPYGQVCTLWTETQHPDGSVTRTRTCNQ
jgi:hypothetical protein